VATLRFGAALLACAAPAIAGADAPLLAKAEVELSGTLERPAGQTGEAWVFITDGECWKPGTRAFGKGIAAPSSDRWGVEVFVPQGTKLWVCAMLAPKPGQKVAMATVYGEPGGAPLLGKGAGEVVFSGLKIKMKRGAPVPVPTIIQ
jgi:hypothetical protein